MKTLWAGACVIITGCAALETLPPIDLNTASNPEACQYWLAKGEELKQSWESTQTSQPQTYQPYQFGTTQAGPEQQLQQTSARAGQTMAQLGTIKGEMKKYCYPRTGLTQPRVPRKRSNIVTD